MKKRILSLLLALLTVVSILPAPTFAAEEGNDYSGDIGKYAKLNGKVTVFTVASAPGSEFSYYHEDFKDDTVLRIAEWQLDDGGRLWYRVEFFSGGVVESTFTIDFPEEPWFLQDTSDGVDALTFVEPCEICGKPGCTAIHFYCDRCLKYDCGMDHLRCLACGEVDCQKSHTWCGLCGKFDCGIEHEDPAPDTVPIIPEHPTMTEGAEVSIVDEYGDPVTEEGYILSAGMKASLSAWTDLEGAVSYQWQIRYDSEQDLWANIQGQTGKGILLSPAMVLSILELDGAAAIRCVVATKTETRTGEAIPVEVGGGMVSLFAEMDMPQVSLMAETGDAGELKKNYVVVQYVFEDGRMAAASDFASIIPGVAYSHSYTLPVIPGYKATLNTHSYGDQVKLENNQLVMNFSAGALADQYAIFTVTYVPDYVKYTVIHYWQNINDDNYTEHEREVITTKHKTGEVITDAHKTYPGFYNLLYETPAAAADGSTVIEVYYDRYYYLMKFNLDDMGYGVDPIYARYGAEIEIGTPTRAGYIFQGWKLNGEGDLIASADMPTTMPDENLEYVAVWEPVPMAKVSVVFWGENPNDEGYSYLTTGVVNVAPGTEYTFADDSTALLICGKDEHTHDADCGIICGKTEHTTHTQDCLACDHTSHTLDCYSTGRYNYYKLVQTSRPSQITEYGEEKVYTYQQYGRTYYYLYLNGSWYCAEEGSYSGGPTTQIQLVCSHTHTDDCYNCEYHEHTADCYSCGLTEHTHTNACRQTGSGLDKALWKFIRSETVTVDADGSSVVNVYYDRNAFTMTFKEEGYNGKTLGTITDKWGADIKARFETISKANTFFWSTSTDGGSPWTSFMDVMPPENRTYYADRQSGSTTITATYLAEKLDGSGYETLYTVSFKGSSTITVTKEEFVDIKGFAFNSEKSTKIGKYYNGAKFYYDRHKYAIEFYNPTSLIKKETGIPYESNLAAYDFTPTADQAPNLYEPGSMKFVGWYLNPECTGEQYILANHTMPSAPNDGDTAVVLYAKWEPVEYKVNFYLTRESLNRSETIPKEMSRLAIAAGKLAANGKAEPYNTVFKEAIVKHGAYLGKSGDPGVSEGYETIHPRAGYDFVGWFYLNEDGEETAFDPENIPVDRDLDLYAKWSSDKLCHYNIYFALDVKNNTTGAAGSDGIADVDTSGNIIYIADPVSGSGIAGRTYTFSAKGGDDLYDGYRDGYFPEVGSHSLVINIADETGTGVNSFTFLYKQRAAVPYTVRYLEKGTDKVLETEKEVNDNRNVVVTENFVYVQGYMPDAYQKTLVVSAADGAVNEIVFYYTKDEQHALYVVNHYIQELDSNLDHSGWSKYTDLQYTGDIDTTYSAAAIRIDGFTLSTAYTDQYNTEIKENGLTGTTLPTAVGPLSTDGKNQISGKLSASGMELNFYYTRNLYPYEFRYMLNGTSTELAAPELGKAAYDAIVTEAAKEIVMDLDGDGVYEDYRLYDPTETTKDIHIIVDGNPLTSDAEVTKGQATVNVATFYYVRCTQTMTIKKTVEQDNPDYAPEEDQTFTFSLLIHSKSGYHQSSYAYTKYDSTNTKVGTETLSPVVGASNTLTFDLKAGEYITIDGLPTAAYTLTEMNIPLGYTAAYAPAQKNKLTVDNPVNVTVTNTYDPAVLTISKIVSIVETASNIPEVEKFEFTITVPDGVTGSYDYTVSPVAEGEAGTRTATVDGGTMTIELKKDQTATFVNLPVGNYIVTEKDYSAEGYESTYTVNNSTPSSNTVTLSPGTKQDMVFTNLFPVFDLTIEKTVQKAFYGTDWNGDTFKFTVTRTSRDLVVGNAYTVLLDGKNAGTATVLNDKTIQVSIVYGAEDAKTLEADGASVTHTLVIQNLPAGTYTVTEDPKPLYTQNPLSIAGVSVKQTGATAEFTNTLKRPTGNLNLQKILEAATGFNPEKLPEGGKFSFTFELKEKPPVGEVAFDVIYDPAKFSDNSDTPTSVTMTSGKFEIELEAGQNVTIAGLPIGLYRITEATIPQYANDFAHKINGEWKPQPAATEDGCLYTEIEVTAGATAQVKCTNTYPVDRAKLIVEKLVTKEYDRDTLPNQDFKFKITLEQNDRETYSYTLNTPGSDPLEQTVTVEDHAFEFTLKAGQYAVFSDMPVCGYTIAETVSEADYTVSHAVYVSNEGETASAPNQTGSGPSVGGTFSAGKTDKVVFTNQYKRHLGRLTINKALNNPTVTPNSSDSDTFLFHIKGTETSNSYIDMDVTIDGESSTTIYDLPLGEYTVTEDTDWNWRYVITGNAAQTVTLTVAAPDASVSFKNTYSENKWLNFFHNVLNEFPKSN